MIYTLETERSCAHPLSGRYDHYVVLLFQENEMLVNRVYLVKKMVRRLRRERK